MKCELCNGKGVINDADTLYGVRYCPQCDAGNLQLRLDHRFQPVLDAQEVPPEHWMEPNPLLAELPFVPVPRLQGTQHALHWKPTTEWPKEPLMRPNFIEGKPATNDEAIEWLKKRPHLLGVIMPPAVKEFVEKQHGVPTTKEEAVAEVHKLLSQAGLCIVPAGPLLSEEQVNKIMDLAGNMARAAGKVQWSACHDALEAHLRSLTNQPKE